MEDNKVTQRDIMTRPERLALFQEIYWIHELLFCRLGFYAGLRLSEILTVRPIDFLINDGQPVIHVRESKRGKSRHACVDMGTYTLALTYAKESNKDKMQAILGEGTIKSDSRLWQRRFKKIVYRAGIVRIEPTPHTLRHTNITMLLEAGMDIEKVRKHAGHSEISTTLVYEHLTYKALAANYHNIVGE